MKERLLLQLRAEVKDAHPELAATVDEATDVRQVAGAWATSPGQVEAVLAAVAASIPGKPPEVASLLHGEHAVGPERAWNALAASYLKPYEWYFDLRRYGSVPHSGFGLGIERLLRWFTGQEHIRDMLPFPRTPNRAYP